MQNRFFTICLTLALLFGSTTKAHSDCSVNLSDFVGWKVIYSGTVTGYIDENGRKQDDFNGCEHGRELIVDYSKKVTCNEYNYSYAYHPDIVVLSNGSSLKACIEDEMYDISR